MKRVMIVVGVVIAMAQTALLAEVIGWQGGSWRYVSIAGGEEFDKDLTSWYHRKYLGRDAYMGYRIYEFIVDENSSVYARSFGSVTQNGVPVEVSCDTNFCCIGGGSRVDVKILERSWANWGSGDNGWISLSPSSGSGSREATLAVDENIFGKDRVSSFEIAGKQIVIH